MANVDNDGIHLRIERIRAGISAAVSRHKGMNFRQTAKTQKGRISLIRRVLADMRARGAILETTDERIKT